MYITIVIPGVFMYLLISSKSCVLSLGVFMAMDSTAPWNNKYTCSGSNSYHIRGKYVLTGICSFISLCMHMCTRWISPGTQGSFWPWWGCPGTLGGPGTVPDWPPGEQETGGELPSNKLCPPNTWGLEGGYLHWASFILSFTRKHCHFSN